MSETTVETNHLNLAGSQELLDRASEVTPGGVHTSIRRIDPQICFERAEGAYLYDVDGNQYIDYHAAFGPFVLGHAYEPVNARVIEAIGRSLATACPSRCWSAVSWRAWHLVGRWPASASLGVILLSCRLPLPLSLAGPPSMRSWKRKPNTGNTGTFG
jgi:hypothetical protein